MVATKPSFRAWLRQFKNDDTPIGDLARDIIEDVRSGCLKYAKTPRGIRAHMDKEHRAHPDALQTVDEAAELYSRA